MSAAAPAPRLLADSSLSALVAGFIAMLTGYTSSLVLMFQAYPVNQSSNGWLGCVFPFQYWRLYFCYPHFWIDDPISPKLHG